MTLLAPNVTPELYVRSLAAAYSLGYRLHDQSEADIQDPDFDRKLLRFPMFLAPLQVRHANIAGRRWTVSPPDEPTEAEKGLARVVGQCLANLDGFTESRLALASADVTGSRYAERIRRTIRAAYGDGKVREWTVPVAHVDMDRRRFRWVPMPDGGGHVRRLEASQIRDGDVEWLPVMQSAPLVRHVVGDREDTLGYGRGLRDALVFIYRVATRVFTADAAAADRFGHGWIVFKRDRDAPSSTSNEAARRQDAAVLQQMRASGNFTIDKNDDLQMLAPPAQAADFMAGLQDRLGRLSDRLIMGATLFAGGGGASEGSMARAETESDTASIVFDLMSDVLEETITRDEVAAIVRDNRATLDSMGFAGCRHPRYAVVRGRKQDPESVAKRVQILLPLGVPLKADEVYDGVGFTQPGPDDVVLESRQMPFPVGADPVSRPEATTAEEMQDRALNGAQVSSLLELVASLVAKQMPADAAVELILAAFPLVGEARARRIVASASRFKPAEAATPVEAATP